MRNSGYTVERAATREDLLAALCAYPAAIPILGPDLKLEEAKQLALALDAVRGKQRFPIFLLMACNQRDPCLPAVLAVPAEHRLRTIVDSVRILMQQAKGE